MCNRARTSATTAAPVQQNGAGLPVGESAAGLDATLTRFRDAGIDNIFDKRYRNHLSIYPEAGRNFKLAASYTLQY